MSLNIGFEFEYFRCSHSQNEEFLLHAVITYNTNLQFISF